MLSSLVRPMMRSCRSIGRASHSAALCFHFCSNRTVPAAPGTPSGRRAAAGASSSVGFSEPSMKPVRSRSCRYDQLDVSSPSEVMDDRAGHIEDNVISTAGQPYQRIMLRAWHNESFCAFDLVVKALHARRGVIWNNIAPELGPKADD